MSNEVRVRFAPSPTGALHIGGVRTALYNYLFAHKHNGTFLLRIEDTDQTRFVPGAEEYIRESLRWLGIEPTEGEGYGGPYGPYKQSERKDIYLKYAQQLIADGKAYYAFDTPEELEAMRERLTAAKVSNPVYDSITRVDMKNSLTLPADEVKALLDSNTPHVVRLNVPANEEVIIEDMIRGTVKVNTATVDDKIILKSDGMPTYHLASVIDDHLMNITHIIRGEEWLPSAPLHVLLYRYLGWEATMPRFAHLPLILKPDGNGKLSKRAADKLGIPLFPMEWKDPATGEVSMGFKQEGYLKEAIVNFLAMLGWNPGTEQEMFTLPQLVEAFTIERINKAGAKFDIDKAKWFNQQYLKELPDEEVSELLKPVLEQHSVSVSGSTLNTISGLMKERITFAKELWDNGRFFFEDPDAYDEKVIEKRWNEEVKKVIAQFGVKLAESSASTSDQIHDVLFAVLEENGMKPGMIMQALRVVVTGMAGGPDLMKTMEVLGSDVVSKRIETAINKLP